MTVMLERPLWSEDCVIRDPWLEERPSGAAPGSLAIHWKGADGDHQVVLTGNDADDFMERYRSTDGYEARVAEMRAAILGAVVG